MEDAINALLTSHDKQRKEQSALRESVKVMCQVMSKTRGTLDSGQVLTNE